MQFLVFILVYPLVWIISILPFKVLYFLSDIFFFITYYVIGYRKKVVHSNLKLVFPEKNDKEITTLTKKSLKHFTDFIFETIKTFTISKKSLEKRYQFSNLKLLQDLEKENRGIILMGVHYANWEWIIHLAQHTSLYPVASYTKIGNDYFEKLIKSSRERFGANFIRSYNIVNTILKFQAENKVGIYGLLSDQSPQLHKTHYWGTFFGQYIPVITGAEFLAKKYNFIVLNIQTTRIKRGYYETAFEIITKEPSQLSEYEITNKYLKSSENHIKKAPEFYLWTHKRFKHLGKYDEWLEMKNKTKQT